ncbi:MAG TPA: DMT family transporter [Gaiellaceae bacterium]|nr:DMT family transporter [Gaiellaceae bacterium]
MLALGLALGAALAWGTADFLGGLTTRGLRVFAVLLVSQGFGLLLVGLLVLVRGEAAPTAGQIVAGVLAGFALAVGLGALYQGMAVGVMSVVSPISATGAAIPIVFGLARGERPSLLQGAGIVAALAGVMLISRQEENDAARRRAGRAGIALGVVAAVGFGVFFVGIDLAAEGGVVWATLLQRLGLLAAVAIAVALVRPSLAVPRRLLPALLAIGVLDLSATMLFTAATQEGLTSLVSVIASLYPAATIALALLVLGERLNRLQQGGAALVLAGVALIAGG